MEGTSRAGPQVFPRRQAGPAWLRWTGLVAYPGVLLFFVSAALSHHLLDIIQGGQYHKLDTESVEAVLLGVLLSAAFIALVRRFHPRAADAFLGTLSVVLLPSVLFALAPFRYLHACRYTLTCDFRVDTLLISGAALCVILGVWVWSAGTRGTLDRLARRVRAVLERASPALLFLAVWMLCTVLLAWRGYDRLVSPELFAEGGRQYVANALNHGWWSLGFFYEGFLHVAPRLIALLATSLAPVSHVPAVTVSACYLIAGAASAFIVRPAFRWIIPSDAARLAAAIMLCLVPGFREVLGSLSNLHYVLFFLMALLALKDPYRPYRGWELLLALVVALSSSLVVALLPAAAARAWIVLRRRGERGLALRVRATEVAFALLVVVTPALLFALALLGSGDATAGGRSPLDGFDPAVVLRAWGTVLTSAFLLNPFAGPGAATEVMLMVSQLVLVAIAGVVFLLLFRSLIRGGHRTQGTLVFAWVAAPFLIVALIALARSPTLKPFLMEEAWHYFKWWMRYNYLPVGFGIVAWLALLRPTRLLPGRRVANVLALTLYVATATQADWYFKVRAHGEETRWLRSSAELERAIRTGCPRSVKVRIYPGNWYFVYHARKVVGRCEGSGE